MRATELAGLTVLAGIVATGCAATVQSGAIQTGGPQGSWDDLTPAAPVAEAAPPEPEQPGGGLPWQILVPLATLVLGPGAGAAVAGIGAAVDRRRPA